MSDISLYSHHIAKKKRKTRLRKGIQRLNKENLKEVQIVEETLVYAQDKKAQAKKETLLTSAKGLMKSQNAIQIDSVKTKSSNKRKSNVKKTIKNEAKNQ